MDKLYFLVSMISILETGPQISTRRGNMIAEMSGNFSKSQSQFSRLSSGSWSRDMRIFLPSSQSRSYAVVLDRRKQIRLRASRSMLRCASTGRQTYLALPMVAHRCVTIWESLRTALGTWRHCYNLVAAVMCLHQCCRCCSVAAMTA
jgi:hypothetical protein